MFAEVQRETPPGKGEGEGESFQVPAPPSLRPLNTKPAKSLPAREPVGPQFPGHVFSQLNGSHWEELSLPSGAG